MPAASTPTLRRRPSEVVAVIGAGASGTLVAAHLLRASQRGWRVILVDRESHARGAAYSTRDPRHRLNVAAGRMSAFDDDPDDFVRWCRARGRATGEHDYEPRQIYGDYLRGLLERFASPGELELVRNRVVSVTRGGERQPLTVAFRDGRSLRADAAVVAIGNPNPAPLANRGCGRRVIDDPWNPRSLERMRDARTIAIVGTGLTAIDISLSVAAASPAATILAISRHGLLPCAQSAEEAAAVPSPFATDRRRLALSELVEGVFDAVAAQPASWRAVIDSLRPQTATLWQALDVEERRTFMLELKWLWDAHRHRMAPAVAQEIAELRARGRLSVRAASVMSVRGADASVEIAIDDDAGRHELSVDYVVNATGPAGAITSHPDPLVRQLLSGGLARADELGIGFACRRDGALLDRAGGADGRLFTLGPPRRGELLESTAVPEIRTQAAMISATLVARGALAAAQRPALAVG
ncbi:MAG: FAD/NAD(P)-binding protein [Solirubrobacteraceae bacterium]|jgi:uncharacterized NAD(P)/FAD-binding protein YdhS